MYDNGTYVLNRSLVISVEDEEHRSDLIFIVKPFYSLEKHNPDFVMIGLLRNRFTALCFVLQPRAPLQQVLVAPDDSDGSWSTLHRELLAQLF